jgi:L-seryl-tRNA(Ser) seleniumtransferase
MAFLDARHSLFAAGGIVMPNKASELLNRLPSVAELLDKPPIRALASRWNRSVVAGGVRSFLDELRSDLERRAADVELPTVRELAERAARHVVALQQHAQRPAINATGRIDGPPWICAPLAEPALERLFSAGRDFIAGPCNKRQQSPADSDAATLLCRTTHAEAAATVHSYAGAVWLTLAALARNQRVLVSRAEMGDIDAGRSLMQLAESAGVEVTEVGATNRALPADYESAISPQTAALLRIHPDGYRIVGDTQIAELDELVALARDRELIVIEAMGGAPLAELPSTMGIDRRSAQSSLASGADLVILRGGGLAVGPPCGILLGRRDPISQILAHPMFAAWQLDPLRDAALTATLESLDSNSANDQSRPVLRLLATPLENLRDRAERLAPQLAQAKGIASATPVPTRCQLSISDASERTLMSYGIALQAAEGDVRGLEKRLAGGPRPVIGRVEDERLVLDLRTVFPRQDHLLVQSIVGNLPAESAE